MGFGRNEECWCGSGKKYKKCHLNNDAKVQTYALKGFEVPDFESIRNIEELNGIRAASVINTAVLDYVCPQIHAGMTTEEVDNLVHDFTLSKGATPAPLNYEGYPKSVCTSVNNEVCHGIPSKDVVLMEGDIVNIDVSTIYKGFYADASRMVMVGDVPQERRRLVEVAKECLDAGLSAVKPWGFVGDIGAAVQEVAEANGYSVVTKFGGHGCGVDFHEDPFIPHVGKRGKGCLLVPGMTFTIEPMINAGDSDLFIDKENGWTAYTIDGKDSAQWEHLILVTEDGFEILSY